MIGCHGLSIRKEYPEAEEVEAGAAVSVHLDPFHSVGVAFDPAGVPVQGEAGGDRVEVLAQAAGQAVQWFEAGLLGFGDPVGEVVAAAFVRPLAQAPAGPSGSGPVTDQASGADAPIGAASRLSRAMAPPGMFTEGCAVADS